jgi:apolipoprotein N-acyltransferase
MGAMVDEVMVQAPRMSSAEPPPEATPAAPATRPLPLWFALPAALAGGGALLASFPPYDQWWLAPVGVALMALAVHRRRALMGFALALVTGITFFFPLISWTGLHVGALPWFLLAGMEACFVGLTGAAGALTSRLVDRWRWSWPLLTGVFWVAQEAARDRSPFGGFPWGRLAFSQGDSPLLRLAVLGGAPLVTFAVAAVGGLIALAARFTPRSVQPERRTGLIAIAIAVAVLAIPLAIPLTSGAGSPTATVAIVQGNVPRLGLEFNAQRRAVLDNHVRATIELAARVKAGTAKQPDLVVWPENASDIDPLINQDASNSIDVAADAIGVPILVGGLLEGPGENLRNVGIVWQPGTGPGAMYVKQHPVPFAEYMPLRPIARMVTEKADLVRHDFLAGAAPGVLRLGPVTVGDVICFEVAYDNIVRNTVTGGAQIITVQTNNATFNAAEARQQLAMVRLRAVEHGRTALMASTVGVSGFVSPTGEVHDATGFDVPAVIIRDVPLQTGRTIATRLGAAPELVLVVLAVAALVVAVRMGRRRSMSGSPEPDPAPVERRQSA